MIGNKKIGVGIVTYNRPDGLRKLYESLPMDVIDELIIVNDGDMHEQFSIILHDVVHNDINLGVGKSKNIALSYLLSKEVEHFFLIEDDVFIKRNDVFQTYISISQKTGIQHLNFSQHGNNNKDATGSPIVNLKVAYDGMELPLYGFCVGAFSYYTKRCLDKIGLMDDGYYNAMEHVDHTISAFKAGMHPPFGYFADIPNSWEYIGDEAWSESQSMICCNDSYNEIRDVAVEYFKGKHGCFPIGFMEKDKNKVIAMLKEVKSKYAKPKIFFGRR
ncbi:glycosyltransferase family 2 protein [Pectobacterium punjabense]|uniref:glycosyltransferase family 2 protein n=1 Tax=Pectobacterium punjabense TaxID=2108399 RepID=UPI003D9B87F6